MKDERPYTVDENGDRWSINGIYMGTAKWSGGKSPLGEAWSRFAKWYDGQRKKTSDAILSWQHRKGCVQHNAAIARSYELQMLYEDQRARLRRGDFPDWHPGEWPELEYGLPREERGEWVRKEQAAKEGTSDIHRKLDRLAEDRPAPPKAEQRGLEFFDDDPVIPF